MAPVIGFKAHRHADGAELLRCFLDSVRPHIEYQEWDQLEARLALAEIDLLGVPRPTAEVIREAAGLLSQGHDVELCAAETRSSRSGRNLVLVSAVLHLEWTHNESWLTCATQLDMNVSFARRSRAWVVFALTIERIAPVQERSSALLPESRLDPSRVLVCTVANHYDPGLAALEESCDRVSLKLQIVGKGAPWRGFGYNKLKMLTWFLSKARGRYDYVLFMDAFDSLAVAGLDTIMRKYHALSVPILFSSEANCFPSRPGETEADYPPAPTRYRFLNSGGFVADFECLLEVLTRMKSTEVPDAICDQGWWTGIYLSGKEEIRLDHSCQVFQSLFAAEGDLAMTRRGIHNRLTGTSPCIFHGNGRSDLNAVADWVLHPRQRHWRWLHRRWKDLLRSIRRKSRKLHARLRS